MKEHNKRLRRQEKETKQQLAAAGISKETQDAMNILPWAEKVPVMIEGSVDVPELPVPASALVPALPGPKEKAEQEAVVISDDELKHLNAVLDQAGQEEDLIPEAEIIPDDELAHLESLLEQVNESEAADPDPVLNPEPESTEDDELKRLEAILNQAEQEKAQVPETDQAPEEDEIERLNKLFDL